jgi:ribonuclease Z
MTGEKIIMLGTGEAVATHCYNTCFTLHAQNTILLVDGGGGNGILRQLEKTGTGLDELDFMFVSHAHTVHILGAVWIIRMMGHRRNKTHRFRVFGNDKVIHTLKTIISLTFNAANIDRLKDTVDFCTLEDGEKFDVGAIHLQCFDIHSMKEKQFGFHAIMPSGTTVSFLGDEPFNEANRQIVLGSDWLMHEVFCLYADREKLRPYEKRHSTALDAGRNASSLHVKNLILYQKGCH